MQIQQQYFPQTISFVVLALNEESFIDNTIETIILAAKNSKISDYEIIMVNDGSSDRTGEIMDQIAACTPKTRTIHNPVNLGLGAAYLKGVKVASLEYIMIIAGDNIMPVNSIAQIASQIGRHDMVLPYMTDDQFREPIRRYGSSGFTWLINLMSENKIKYYNGMVVRRILFNGEVIDSTGYSLMAECVLKFLKKGATYSEVGVNHGYPILSKSNSKALQLKNLKNLFFSLIKIYQICKK